MAHSRKTFKGELAALMTVRIVLVARRMQAWSEAGMALPRTGDFIDHAAALSQMRTGTTTEDHEETP